MPLFGPKPNKIFVFIHYKTDPPTESQRAEIMAFLPKASAPYIYAEAVQLPKDMEGTMENPENYGKLQIAYIKMVSAKYMFDHGIGTYSKEVEHKTRKIADFLVTTAIGKFT
jgi:hypothetical protein